MVEAPLRRLTTRNSVPNVVRPGYALTVLTAVYVFNLVDRSILSILATRIAADLSINDASLGFLYGTAFAVFYAIMGMPLGRLADAWRRPSLLAIGLLLWSGMTLLSGFADAFWLLAIARIGVAVGEATLSPCAMPLLSSYYTKASRASALGTYSSGVYIGTGVGLLLGGVVLEYWDWLVAMGYVPFSLRSWQVAFIAAGLPGVLLSALVSRLPEPRVNNFSVLKAGKLLVSELTAMAPFVGGVQAVRNGQVRLYLAINGVIIGGCLAGWLITRDTAQWLVLALGLLSLAAWSLSVKRRDPETYGLLWSSPTFGRVCIGFGLVSLLGYTLAFWSAPYAVRYLGMSIGEVGAKLGVIAAVAGWSGATLGGRLSDYCYARDQRGRLFLVAVAMTLMAPAALLMFSTSNATIFFLLYGAVTFFQSAYLGPAAATINDIAPQEKRGVASAFYVVAITVIGLALGPYLVGKGSDHLHSLRAALIATYVLAAPTAVIFLIGATRGVRGERAQAEVRS